MPRGMGYGKAANKKVAGKSKKKAAKKTQADRVAIMRKRKKG